MNTIKNEVPAGYVLLQRHEGKALYAACMDGGRFHGWLFKKGLEAGQWVSERKLEQWEIMQAEDQRDDNIVHETSTPLATPADAGAGLIPTTGNAQIDGFLADYEIRADEGVYALTAHDRWVIANFLIELDEELPFLARLSTPTTNKPLIGSNSLSSEEAATGAQALPLARFENVRGFDCEALYVQFDEGSKEGRSVYSNGDRGLTVYTREEAARYVEIGSWRAAKSPAPGAPVTNAGRFDPDLLARAAAHAGFPNLSGFLMPPRTNDHITGELEEFAKYIAGQSPAPVTVAAEIADRLRAYCSNPSLPALVVETMRTAADALAHSGAQVPSIGDAYEFKRLLAQFHDVPDDGEGWSDEEKAFIAFIDSHIATHSAPAEWVAIRDQALDSAASVCFKASNPSLGDAILRLKSQPSASPTAVEAQPTVTPQKVEASSEAPPFYECAANMNGHKFEDFGPHGEQQCEWCGEVQLGDAASHAQSKKGGDENG